MFTGGTIWGFVETPSCSNTTLETHKGKNKDLEKGQRNPIDKGGLIEARVELATPRTQEGRLWQGPWTNEILK